MNIQSLTTFTGATVVALAIVVMMSSANSEIIKPSYAQPTFDTPSTTGGSPDSTPTGSSDEGENFQQFMECLFGGEVSEEDITNALDGSSDSTPTEQEIRDCFAPLYNTGTATDATTPTVGGSTADSGDESSEDEVDSSSESDPSNNQD
ncbi:hypothetical protein BH18THE2_BH18THE2_17400 [soil metagenome]